ncbi:alpha/beta hydrolase [Halorhabdus sp. CUG00001]|uniref:alpha/beta hydrolase n=1 Tax=Halorhabdus sp. CUG00001 TaxID=2600297 RepID=UPI00131D28E3|nr:alpha/beta hydrolase [Halorhabdus sp. CUG00001]
MRADEMHPQARAIVDRQRRLGLPPISRYDRRLIRALERIGTWIGGRGSPAVGATTDGTIPGPDDDIPVRVYQPDQPGPYPTLVYFHGGGFVFGSIATHDTVCRRLARETGAVVVSVAYRLAPEHPFPAAVEDAFAATRWAATNPDRLDSDGHLAVAGDSAGGTLAAVSALLARDRDGPAIDYQILLYPGIGIRDDQHSVAQNDGIALAAEDLEWFQECYYESELDSHNPYADPIHARDLAGVAPATVVTAGFDPLRDGGLAYAQRLESDGVAVTHRHEDDMIHGFLTADIDRAETIVCDVATDMHAAIGMR